jgi:hypothetical protein
VIKPRARTRKHELSGSEPQYRSVQSVPAAKWDELAIKVRKFDTKNGVNENSRDALLKAGRVLKNQLERVARFLLMVIPHAAQKCSIMLSRFTSATKLAGWHVGGGRSRRGCIVAPCRVVSH